MMLIIMIAVGVVLGLILFSAIDVFITLGMVLLVFLAMFAPGVVIIFGLITSSLQISLAGVALYVIAYLIMIAYRKLNGCDQ